MQQFVRRGKTSFALVRITGMLFGRKIFRSCGTQSAAYASKSVLSLKKSVIFQKTAFKLGGAENAYFLAKKTRARRETPQRSKIQRMLLKSVGFCIEKKAINNGLAVCAQGQNIFCPCRHHRNAVWAKDFSPLRHAICGLCKKSGLSLKKKRDFLENRIKLG